MDGSKTMAVITNIKSEAAGPDEKDAIDSAANEPHRPSRKPKWATLSYIAAISQAILTSPMKRLPLAEIYQFIEEKHPEFKEGRPRWKNTVRHNLSLHECFVKGEMTANQKCCYWKIHPRYLARFSRGDFSRRPADVDTDYREQLLSLASYPPPARSDMREAVGFYAWMPPYPLAGPMRAAEEWYQPLNPFLHRPTAMGAYPPTIRGNPHQDLLYQLSEVWSKNKRYSTDSTPLF